MGIKSGFRKFAKRCTSLCSPQLGHSLVEFAISFLLERYSLSKFSQFTVIRGAVGTRIWQHSSLKPQQNNFPAPKWQEETRRNLHRGARWGQDIKEQPMGCTGQRSGLWSHVGHQGRPTALNKHAWSPKPTQYRNMMVLTGNWRWRAGRREARFMRPEKRVFCKNAMIAGVTVACPALPQI